MAIPLIKENKLFQGNPTRGIKLLPEQPQDPADGPYGSSSSKNESATQMGMDLQKYLDRGSSGLDFVYAANTPVYYTMGDNVQVIDARSIQHHGSSRTGHLGSR